jgi:hypothetical protein
MDASDIEPLSTRYYGCSVVGLYNCGRPHMSLGPGLPDPPPEPAFPEQQKSRHRVSVPLRVNVKSVLGGLHHEYALQAAAR